MNNKRDMQRRAIALASITTVITGLIILIVYSKIRFDIGVLCPFKEQFNWDCPGCGGTRMAVSLYQGSIIQAFRWNPFMFITVPLLLILYMWQSYMFILCNKLIVWLDKFLIIYAILLIVFGILRNTNMFIYLAPTQL